MSATPIFDQLVVETRNRRTVEALARMGEAVSRAMSDAIVRAADSVAAVCEAISRAQLR